MSYALIAHKETNGTSVALASSGSDSDFRTRKLTDLLVNQQFSVTEDTVDAFRPSTAGVGPSQFDLNIGVYRITAWVAHSNLLNNTASGSMAGLYNVTDARFEYHFGGGTDPIISMASLVQTGGTSTNTTDGYCLIDTQFSVTGSVKTFEIRQSVFRGGGGAATVAGTAGAKSKVTTGTMKETYASIKITRLS